MKLSEPAIAYDSVPLQQLKSRLVETIGMENRVIKLQQCLDLLQNDDEEIAQREEEFLKNIPVATLLPDFDGLLQKVLFSSHPA